MMNKAKLLIVDDEPDIRKVLKKRLETAGFECFTAADATEAIRLAKHKQPSLIILDLVLPGRDGVQIYQELKSSEDTNHIPIIVYTAQNPDIVVKKGLQALSIVDFVLKPFDSQALISLINLSLEEKKPKS